MSKKIVFVLGAPGVGKGTQCRRISQKYGFVHVSAGELLRKEMLSRNSEHGALIESCIKEGKIVPSDITCKLLDNFIEESRKSHFLIDGFPRNQENREGWYRLIGSRIKVMFVLFIECPVEICMERCLNRGAAAGSDRHDDTIEVIQKRVNTHIEETQPTVDYFAAMNLVKFVNGNQSEDAVFGDIQKIFDAYHIEKS